MNRADADMIEALAKLLFPAPRDRYVPKAWQSPTNAGCCGRCGKLESEHAHAHAPNTAKAVS